MSALKDRIKKQTQVQAKQNRKNRVERSVKNSPNKNKPSKSDYKYIEGNISGSASGKHYGIKKYGDGDFSYYKKNYEAGHQKLANYEKQQKGENPYEVKYKRTAGIKTQPGGVNKEGKKYNSFKTYNERLTNKEQNNYKKYGTLTKPDSELEKKVKKVASGVGKAVLGGLDIMGTPGYLITGATKGMVDGFNGNGKLDKGELKNAIKGATKNIKTSWDNKGNHKGEGKFGFGDIFDSVDALEDRKKTNDPNYESKKIYRASTGNGFDRDKLSDKTKKTLNTIGGMGLDMALPMEISLPLGTLVKGTGKSFTNVAKKIDAGDVTKIFDKMSKGKNVDDIAREVLIHKAINKANKLAGNIDTNSMEGVKLLGKELLSGEQVAKIGDATGVSRAYNQIRHFMQKNQRNTNLEDVVANVAKSQLGENNGLMKIASRTPLNMGKEQYDLAMGFRPDFRLKQEAKELDKKFIDKVGKNVPSEKPKWMLSEGEIKDIKINKPNVKIDNESIQEYLKRFEKPIEEKPFNIDFDDIEFDDTPSSPTKSFDEQIKELIGLGDDAEINTINNSDMSQLDNIPFDAIQAKRKPRNRRAGNAPEGTMFPYVDEMSGKYNYNADELDADILNERAYNKISDSNRRNKINETNEKLKESNEIAEAFMEKFGAKKVKTNVNNIDEGVEALLNIFDKPKTKTKLKTLSQRREAFNSMFDYVDINNLTEEQADIIKSIKHIGNKVNTKDKDALIANINNIFFGGQGVVPENVSASKLKKISKFFDDVKNPLNKTQFNKEGASLLRADLTDPIFEKKQDLLKSQFGTKGSLQDSINKTHFKAEEARRKGLTDEYERLTSKVDELSQKLIDRENLWSEIREMESEDFFAKYPNMASKYFESPINEHSLNQNYKDVISEVSENLTERGDSISNAKYDRAVGMKDRAFDHTNLDKNYDEKLNAYQQGTLKEQIDRQRKRLKLNYVDLKNRVPSKFAELENYNFNSNKSVKTAKKNLVELIKERESLRFKYYNQPESFRQIEADAVNKLIKQQLNYLDRLGVPQHTYLDNMKKYVTSIQMLQENLQSNSPLMKLAKTNRPNVSYSDEIEEVISDVSPVLKMNIQMLADRVKSGENIENLIKEVTDEFVEGFNHSLSDIVGDAEFNDVTLPVRSEDAQVRDIFGMKGRKEYKGSNPVDDVAFDNELFEGLNSGIDVDSDIKPSEPITEASIKEQIDKLMGVEGKLPEGELNMPERPTTEQIDKMIKKENMKKLNPLSLYDGVLKDFKSNVTVNNPGWHGGNFVQNKLLNAQDIGIRSFFPRTDALDVYRGKSGEIVNEATGEIMDYDKFRRYLEEGGLMDNFINKEVQSSSEGNPLSKLFHNVLRPSGKNSIGSGFGLLQKNPDETLAKIQNVMAHMEDGDDVLTAMDKAQKTLFDYDDLSDKEKNIAKRIIPFYAYAKKNTANQLGYLANDQRTHSKLLNAYRNINEKIPYGEEREIKDYEENYLNGRIQMPGMYKEHEGQRYDYMLNPKLPFNPIDSADGMRNLSPLLNPLVDIAKNENFFGEEIENPVKYYLDEIKRSYTHPVLKSKERIDKYKEDGKDFKIPPEILKILVGISGNYY